MRRSFHAVLLLLLVLMGSSAWSDEAETVTSQAQLRRFTGANNTGGGDDTTTESTEVGVITAATNNATSQPKDSCPGYCHNRGTCDDSELPPVCTCNSGYEGDRCENESGETRLWWIGIIAFVLLCAFSCCCCQRKIKNQFWPNHDAK